MAVKATVSEIRKCLVFTDGMRPPAIERLEDSKAAELAIRVHMRNARLHLHKSLDPTDLWTYDGFYPGKCFFVRHDQTVAVEWINELTGTLPVVVVESGYVPLDSTYAHPENEPGAFDGGKDQAHPVRTPCKVDVDAKALTAWTVVHLHGARVAPDSDGWTENAFLSRTIQTDSQRSHYPPQPRSMMLWYHDHAYTITRLNVFAGLAGGWIIRGPEELRLNLPVGNYELPLILQDRNFDTDGDCLSGRLIHKAETDSSKFKPTGDNPTPSDTAEFFGPFTLVNGSLWPSVPVHSKPYRFRVLNGSNARTYQLFLMDEKGNCRNDLIRQIGTDAGLLSSAVSIESLKYGSSWPDQAGKPKGLILAPAERADLIVDFQCAAGQTLRWINTAVAPYDGVPSLVSPAGPFDTQEQQLMQDRLPFPEVMQFAVDKGKDDKPLELPTPLSDFKPWKHDSPELKGHRHRWLALNEKLKGTDPQEGYLFFNELVELSRDDPQKEDFTLKLAEDSTIHRFRNRRVFFRSPINFYPEANKPEVWHLVNFSADSHPVHLHLVDFQVLSRYFYTVNGATDPAIVDATDKATGLFPSTKPPIFTAIVPDPKRPNDKGNPHGVDANEVGWKDVVRVNPNEIVTIAMIFEGFTGRFMYHCHILEHEDMDMMRPMVVVPPTVKDAIAEMQMMAGDEPDQQGMMGMPGMRTNKR
jgi:FtsP/CotA-like multicopper oxidase with cupredoxin domain